MKRISCGVPGLGMQSLGTQGGSESRARGINDATQVVGFSQIADGNDHAHLAPGRYHIFTYLPANCSSQHNIFTEEFTVLDGHMLDIEWPIVCSP
jgi:probable HAF family extracellular repeat protein